MFLYRPEADGRERWSPVVSSTRSARGRTVSQHKMCFEEVVQVAQSRNREARCSGVASIGVSCLTLKKLANKQNTTNFSSQNNLFFFLKKAKMQFTAQLS